MTGTAIGTVISSADLLDLAEGEPQRIAAPVGFAAQEPVGDDHPLDQVGQYRRPRPTAPLHGDADRTRSPANAAMSPGDTGGTTEAGNREAQPASGVSQSLRSGGEGKCGRVHDKNQYDKPL